VLAVLLAAPIAKAWCQVSCDAAASPRAAHVCRFHPRASGPVIGARDACVEAIASTVAVPSYGVAIDGLPGNAVYVPLAVTAARDTARAPLSASLAGPPGQFSIALRV
jgi:hypothetical protein